MLGYHYQMIFLLLVFYGGRGVESGGSDEEEKLSGNYYYYYSKPLNCLKYECPSYSVLHSEPRYEIRAYNKAKWMSFPVNDSNSFKDASTRGFFQLFDYINGKNLEGINIRITAPVLVEIGGLVTNSSTNGSYYSPYSVNFYIPKQYQSNPPLSVFETYRPVILPPKRFAAVRRFGGFSNDKSIQKQALALKRYLRGTPWEAASEVQLYSQAGYNPPYQRNNRVNEIIIWFDL